MSVKPSTASELRWEMNTKPPSEPATAISNILSCPSVYAMPPVPSKDTSTMLSVNSLTNLPSPTLTTFSYTPILSKNTSYMSVRFSKKLLEHGLFVKLEKCQFSVQEISFLGFVISPQGISMDSDRISTISEWPVPRSVTDIQVFLGFANFYRRFIDGYSRVVMPITSLLRTKGAPPFEWSPTAQEAFDRLKVLFTSTPILRHFDPGLPVTLHSDSSGFAISGII